MTNGKLLCLFSNRGQGGSKLGTGIAFLYGEGEIFGLLVV